jgi:hypothetical protein
MRKIFETKRKEVAGGWRNCIMRSFIICTFHTHTHTIRLIKGGINEA